MGMAGNEDRLIEQRWPRTYLRARILMPWQKEIDFAENTFPGLAQRSVPSAVNS